MTIDAMRAVFEEMESFSKSTFADATASDHLLKLSNEVRELIASPKDALEYADCLLCLFAAAAKAGINYYGLLGATCYKMDVNKRRKWGKLPDGTYQHIKEEQP